MPHDPRRSLLVLTSAFTLAVVFATAAVAAVGDLDTTFGADGKVTTTFKTFAIAWDVAAQSDGKIVAVGQAGRRFALTRYDTDGTLDPTFGGDGTVTTSFGSPAIAYGVAIQPDGKIVAAGTVAYARLALVRYNADGTLDTSFGGDGMVTTDFVPGDEAVNAVVVQADGKIVAAGSSGGFALVRYRANGTVDTSFGDDGRVAIFHRGGVANDIDVQPDGKIVAVGDRITAGGFAVARFDSDGALDGTFSGNGKVTTAFASGGGATAVALQADGKVVVAGTAGDIFGPFAVARYTTSGELDTTFGGDGTVTTNTGRGEESASGVVVQADGGIVAGGYSGVPHEGGEKGIGKFALVRYDASGALDATFGGDGKVTTRFGRKMALANGVALEPDGKVVAAGWAGDGFALARFLAA